MLSEQRFEAWIESQSQAAGGQVLGLLAQGVLVEELLQSLE
jgi:hypothetical protein